MLKESLYKQYHYFLSHRDIFRIMYDIGNVRKQTKNSKIDEFLKLDTQLTESIKNIVIIGQNDGTISDKEDALSTTINLKFIITSIFDKLIIVGENYSKQICKSQDAFAKQLLCFILNSLKV